MTPADKLLSVQDFVTVRQRASAVSVAFDDDAVADYFEHQVDAGRKPKQFARIWLHTHPGDSPQPSGTDEETFERVFGGCDWAVMFILARAGQTYARLQFNTGPRGRVILPVVVDYETAFAGSHHDAWRAEYERNVQPETLIRQPAGGLAWDGDDLVDMSSNREAIDHSTFEFEGIDDPFDELEIWT